MSAAQPPPRCPLVPAVAIATLAGAGVMIVELGAARCITPYFGQSLYVWTNLIGVVLAALALGGFAGGRLADRLTHPAWLGGLLALAALLCGVAPMLVGPLARSLLAPGVDLEVAFEFLAKGSLVTAILIFAPPVVALGTIMPYLVKLVGWDPARLGRRTGLVYAASSGGSIAGTFLTSYVLVPHLGSRLTFTVAAGLLLLATALALVSVRPENRPGKRPLPPIILLIAAATLSTAVPLLGFPVARASDVITERDTAYQYIRVRRGWAPGVRLLTLNEGLDSFHSITIENQILTDGQYYDYHNLLAAMLLPRPSLEVAILGLAAGTNARQLLAIFADRTRIGIDGVEIDPEVVDVGHEFMGLPSDERLREITMDGRSFLYASRTRYDLVLIDAYAHQAYIPFHMATREFFSLVRERLVPDGLVGINIGAYSRSDPVLRAIVNTMASVFGSVIEAKIPRGRNYLVYSRADGRPLPAAHWEPEDLPEILVPLRDDLASPGTSIVRREVDGDLLLTDDRAPIETLEDSVLRQRASRLLEAAASDATGGAGR